MSMDSIGQYIATHPEIIIASVFGLIAMGLFIANISMLAKNGVMADSYSDLKGQITSIWSLGGVGIIFSTLAIWIFCNQSDQSSAIFIALIVSSLAIFISYCAMATAVIVKK
jgi:hypothetical protein